MPDFIADTDWAFARYEQVRDVLPRAQFAQKPCHIANLGDVANRFDVFLLDAFGVLNIGETPVFGAPARIAALQEMGKTTFVLTNGASLPASVTLAKYRKFGYAFAPENVISSREILMAELRQHPPRRWGCMALHGSRLDEFPADLAPLGDDRAAYDAMEGFILLGTADWTDARHEMLIASLKINPRPILVGNPDIVAPREESFTLEAGWFAHDIARRTGIAPRFSGKPFNAIFAEARKRIPAHIPNHRIAMVGDTLHTDILGAKAAGFGTVLILDHGLFRGKNIAPYMEKSGIVPDFIAPTP